jgi:hypothetical protein
MEDGGLRMLSAAERAILIELLLRVAGLAAPRPAPDAHAREH